ncbi:MAG: N-acetyltransferase [candidate division Zixibacteria bacterium]|nr:N-acetyltransferase [candidate division Zixibacteria bacterium]
MPNIEVAEVESSAQLKKFISYPNDLYRSEPNYVTPLLSERKEFFDREKNPFYKSASVKLFLAMQGKEVVGRIATCINYNHNQVHEEQVGFFGFFDCPDDYEIASTLLKVAMITLKKAGMEKMRGPMNFSTNHECAFLVEGFDSPPTVMMPFNQPYLPRLAEKFGLKKVMDLVAYRIISEDPISERMQKVVKKMQARSRITIRGIKMSDYNNELQRVKAIYDSAWEPNWGFVPMDEEEFDYVARRLKQIVDPELALIAEFEGKPVACSLALPDFNQALIHLKGRLFPTGLLKLLWHTKVRNKVRCVRLIMFGVVPEFQRRGIDSLMYVETYNRAIARGYDWAELSWILETNELMRRAIEQMGGKLFKRYRVVEMPL